MPRYAADQEGLRSDLVDLSAKAIVQSLLSFSASDVGIQDLLALHGETNEEKLRDTRFTLEKAESYGKMQNLFVSYLETRAQGLMELMNASPAQCNEILEAMAPLGPIWIRAMASLRKAEPSQAVVGRLCAEAGSWGGLKHRVWRP